MVVRSFGFTWRGYPSDAMRSTVAPVPKMGGVSTNRSESRKARRLRIGLCKPDGAVGADVYGFTADGNQSIDAGRRAKLDGPIFGQGPLPLELLLVEVP